MRTDIIHRKTGGTVLVLDLVVMAHKASALFIAENSVITYKSRALQSGHLKCFLQRDAEINTDTHNDVICWFGCGTK